MAGRRVRFGDGELVAVVDGDRRVVAEVEHLALIVADDDHEVEVQRHAGPRPSRAIAAWHASHFWRHTSRRLMVGQLVAARRGDRGGRSDDSVAVVVAGGHVGRCPQRPHALRGPERASGCASFPRRPPAGSSRLVRPRSPRPAHRRRRGVVAQPHRVVPLLDGPARVGRRSGSSARRRAGSGMRPTDRGELRPHCFGRHRCVVEAAQPVRPRDALGSAPGRARDPDGSSPRSTASMSAMSRLRNSWTPRSLRTEVLAGAVGDRALTDPADRVLVQHVASSAASRRRRGSAPTTTGSRPGGTGPAPRSPGRRSTPRSTCACRRSAPATRNAPARTGSA